MKKFRVVLLISLIVLIGITVWTWPDGKVRVIFCDVGQGDGILISQGTFQMLVDTGPENNKIVGCLGRYMPFWDKNVETVIITHWDKDHSGGLKQVGRNYQVGGLYGSTEPVDENVQNIYSGNLALGDVIKYGLIQLEVLNPDHDWGNDNDNSVVGKLSVGGRVNFLLMGDASAEVEQKLVWRGVLRPAAAGLGTLNVLKVSHHGSVEGTSEELLQTIRPAEAIISVGKNSFGHPTKEVLNRLDKANVMIRRTDREGDVVYKL
jgi:competence protein ComEC